MIVETRAACRRVGSHFVFRVPRHIKARVSATLADGSRRIRVVVRERRRPWHIERWLEIREIRVQVGRKGFRRHELRLCTSLLDHRIAPALALAKLYATR